MLEARDVFDVLEQKKGRPLALEAKALRLAGKLLNLCFADTREKKDLLGDDVARDILQSGKALAELREIIKVQGGDPAIDSSKLQPGKATYHVTSPRHGHIVSIDNKQITVLCRILGCPTDKKAGMFLNKKLDEEVDKGDILCTIYSSDRFRLKEAVDTLKNIPVYTVE